MPEIPNLFGKSKTEAEETLARVGLVLGTVTQVDGGTTGLGVVVETDPSTNATVEIGTTVNMRLSLVSPRAEVQVGNEPDPSIDNGVTASELKSIDAQNNQENLQATKQDMPSLSALSQESRSSDGGVRSRSRSGDPSTSKTCSSDGPSELDPLLKQELNEVYLLLDFMSGQPDRHLADLDGKIDSPEGDVVQGLIKKMTSMEIISRVSEIRYPPRSPGRAQFNDAAFLLTLKDILNSLVHPAKGSTIAFTLMCAENQGNESSPRLDAAELAFPRLVSCATLFRKTQKRLIYSGLGIAVLSALTLWQVTYGAQLAARFDEAKRNDTQSAARVYDQLDKDQGKNDVAVIPTLKNICRIRIKENSDDKTADPRNTATRQLCDDYAYRHALLCETIDDVSTFGRSFTFWAVSAFLPVHKIEPAERCDTDAAKDVAKVEGAPEQSGAHDLPTSQEDAPSVAGIMSMMSNYALPMMFGLVGTITAVVRTIQDKMSRSVLSPADRSLSFIRLPLGMVAGVAVGLFFTPTGSGGLTPGVTGAFTISASGIAFLAGYGAESFFQLLDSLLLKIFSADNALKPSGVSSPRA